MFTCGDVVCLKNGGPYLIVFSCDSKGVCCWWFNRRDELCEQTFPVNCAQLIQEAVTVTEV